MSQIDFQNACDAEDLNTINSLIGAQSSRTISACILDGVHRNNLKTVKHLVQYRGDKAWVHMINPLSLAVTYGHLEMVDFLFSRFSHKNHSGNSLLQAAAMSHSHNKISIIDRLLAVKPNQAEEAFIQAAFCGNLEIVDYLWPKINLAHPTIQDFLHQDYYDAGHLEAVKSVQEKIKLMQKIESDIVSNTYKI